MRKRLVVDASVGKAAGDENAEAESSKCCRDFLMAMYEICHKAVDTPEIRDEWKRHDSRYFRRWRTQMEMKDKMWRPDEDSLSEASRDLRDLVVEVIPATDARMRRELAKDCHLLAAALEADQIVISLDENAHVGFRRISPRRTSVARINWVNPEEDCEDVLRWLRAGATREKRRQIDPAAL